MQNSSFKEIAEKAVYIEVRSLIATGLQEISDQQFVEDEEAMWEELEE